MLHYNIRTFILVKHYNVREINMKYEDEFINWLYTQHNIGNGDTLIKYMEDGHSYDNFLNEMGLEDD